MLRRPKHSKIEVVAPKEEEQEQGQQQPPPPPPPVTFPGEVVVASEHLQTVQHYVRICMFARLK